jgi:uncharacterized membrane protein YqhA
MFDLVPASLPFATPTERTPTCLAVLRWQFRSMLSAQWSAPLDTPFVGGILWLVFLRGYTCFVRIIDRSQVNS